jgi:hypothetical protein
VIKRSIFLLIVPLSLSAVTHMWNPVGFPDIFYDEGVYMRRAMHVLSGLGPQESTTYYDHPYFGQLFLASIFKVIGFPGSAHHTTDINSIKELYEIPRILMGMLAVVDTLLIYKISERRFSQNVAIFASILFAVMPMTWLTRRILLDSILLPFLLGSILTAVYLKNNFGYKIENKSNLFFKIIHNETILILLSGTLMGLAIFTKIPAFVAIPLVGYLIFTNSNKRWKILGLWFIPVILIPLIWPADSLAHGNFNYWINTLVFQSNRDGQPFLYTIDILVKLDPFIIILGAIGILYAAAKRNLFIILWAGSSIAFHYLIGYYQYREFISVLPLLCISAALLMDDILKRIKIRHVKILRFSIVLGITIFGLASTMPVITTNLTTSQFEAFAFVSNYLLDEDVRNENITLISAPIYSWVFKYVYQMDHVLSDYRDMIYHPVPTHKTLLIADEHFDRGSSNEKLSTLYKKSSIIAGFNGTRNSYDARDYPYTSLLLNNQGRKEIQILIGNNG